MPKRPRQHVLEDQARANLHKIFTGNHWTVEDLSKDYGEDLLVRIFDNETSTPWSFFVQSKATDNLNRYLLKSSKTISYPITTEHVLHWTRFYEPVVLAIYDATKEVTYWEIIQNCIDVRPGSLEKCLNKSLQVHVSTDNILDAEGLHLLRNQTKVRFERFEAQKEGAQILIDELQRQWGVQISYDPEFGLLMLPKGKFEPDESNDMICTAFGRLAAMAQRIQKMSGMTAQQVLEMTLEIGVDALSATPIEDIMDRLVEAKRFWELHED